MNNCATGVCGTGFASLGPLPGDPDVNSPVVFAVPGFGGIDVSWTYPNTNPYAVAYVLLYRGTSNDANSAVQIAIVAGNSYTDKLNSSETYFYWIRIVSINGTQGELLGPASATSKTLTESMMEQLTGQIDSGVLAQSLKSDISRIDLLQSNLQSEISSREDGNTSLATSIQEASDGVAQALTFIGTETQTRNQQNSLLVDQLNAVAVTSGQNLAAVQQDLQAKIDTVDGRVTATSTKTDQVAAQAASDLAAAQTTLNASISTVDGRVTALSSHVDTVQSQVGTDLASVQTTLQTNINTVSGKADALGALYSAKVSVNGLVGGFAIYNNGQSVDAGFDVSTFWVGSTAANKRKPFVISNGVTYIDQALINNLTFTKLQDASGNFVVGADGRMQAQYLHVTSASIDDLSVKVAKLGNYICSNNFNGHLDANEYISDYGTDGWAVDKAGHSVFTSVIVRKVIDEWSKQVIPSVSSAAWQGNMPDTGGLSTSGSGIYVANPDNGWNGSLRLYGSANHAGVPMNQRVRYCPDPAHPVTFIISVNTMCDAFVTLWVRFGGIAWIPLFITDTGGGGDSFGTINYTLTTQDTRVFPAQVFTEWSYLDFAVTGTGDFGTGYGQADRYQFYNSAKRYLNYVNFTLNTVNV